MTDFRLLQLGKDHRGEVLPKGAPTLLAKGVLVTLADNDGNVMIEHSNGLVGSVIADVKVDGQPVYEVAHVRPLQVIQVDGSRFVLMPPYGAFVQQRTGKEPVALAKETPKAKKTKVKAKAKVESAEPRRLKLVYVAVPAFLAFLGIGVSLVPEKEAKSIERAEESSAVESEDPAGEASAQSEADAVAVPDEAAAVDLAPEPLAASPVPAPAAAQAPVPAAVPAPAVEPAPAKPVKAAVPKATVAPAAAGKALSPEREAQVKNLAESYQLEGGFDPEGAVRKLKALKKQVPANARVQRDIDRALHAVGG